MVVVGLSCLRPCRKLFHKGGGNVGGTGLGEHVFLRRGNCAGAGSFEGSTEGMKISLLM